MACCTEAETGDGGYPDGVPLTQRFLFLLISAVGGYAAHFAFPQASIWPLAMVGLALLLWTVHSHSAKWAFLMGTVWGLGHFLPLLWWAYASVGALPWVALSVSQALMMALAPTLYVWLMRIPRWSGLKVLSSVPFAATWVAAEQLRHQVPFGGFPWVRIAFSQNDGPLLRLASLGGAPLVSFVVALIAALLFIGVNAIRKRDIVRIPLSVLLVTGCLMAPLAIALDTRAENGTITVGAVQGNVSNPGLDAFSNAREVTENHRDGTAHLIEDNGEMDMVLWPENASDYDPRSDETAREMVNQAATIAQAPILVGTVRYEEDARYNEIVLWDGYDGVGDVYAKQVPAAFAEYVPLRELIRPIAPVVDLVSVDMAPGEEPAVLDVPVSDLDRDVSVATIICFEVAYDWLNTDAVNEGAEFLYVPTNNASFGWTTESDQQLAMTQFRAVEHGRAAVQISTVGVSGYSTPDGELHSVTELFTADEFAAEIPLRTSKTWATKLGQWPVFALSTLVGVGVLIGMFSYRVPVNSKRDRK